MKKRIVRLSILTMAFFAVSCENNENNESNEIKNEIELKSVSEDDGWGLHRHLVYTKDTCYCEEGQPLNCFDDIVIVAKPVELNVIREMELQPLNTSAIWNIIVPYISNDKRLLETLGSGDYFVRTLPSDDVSRILCGILRRNSNDIVYTFQFIAR